VLLALVGFVVAWSISKPSNTQPTHGAEPEPSNSLSAEALYALASPGVVTVTVKNDDGDSIGLGSGFFLKDDLVRDRNELRNSADTLSTSEGQPIQAAYLVTNYHVIHPAVDAEIAMKGACRCFVWEVVTEDEAADLAVLSLLVYSSNSLTQLPLADETPSVGTGVYAIGSPQGLANSLSAGIVSGMREIKPGVSWLQATAPISPGSSGGPLLNSEGKVVGVTTAVLRDGQNLNFAVPVSKLSQLLAIPYRTRNLSDGRSIRQQERDAFHQPLGANSVLRVARDQIANKHYDDAIATLERGKSTVPTEFTYLCHYLLGKAHYELATNAANRAGGATIEAFRAAFLYTDHSRSALESLKQAQQLKPTFAPTFEWLIYYHNSAGHWDESLLVADSLVKLMPACADAYYLRGVSHYHLEKYESALVDLRVALELNPRSAAGHFEIAGVWSALQQEEKAIDSYNTALSLNYIPAFGCHFNIGDSYQKARKYQLAIHSFEKARALGMPAKLCDERIAVCRNLDAMPLVGRPAPGQGERIMNPPALAPKGEEMSEKVERIKTQLHVRTYKVTELEEIMGRRTDKFDYFLPDVDVPEFNRKAGLNACIRRYFPFEVPGVAEPRYRVNLLFQNLEDGKGLQLTSWYFRSPN
jgi:S1-C subfamily serine protease